MSKEFDIAKIKEFTDVLMKLAKRYHHEINLLGNCYFELFTDENGRVTGLRILDYKEWSKIK